MGRWVVLLGSVAGSLKIASFGTALVVRMMRVMKLMRAFID